MLAIDISRHPAEYFPSSLAGETLEWRQFVPKCPEIYYPGQ